MAMQDDDVLEFNFEGVEPAVFGSFVTLPKGEYNLQCLRARRYFKGDEGGNKTGDASKPGLEFTFSVNNHPTFTGTELKLWHPLAESNQKFLLNTLMCLIPEFDWQRNGIKVPLSQLIQKVQGRPCNGLIEWEIKVKNDKKYVNNSLNSLKPFDQSITQPVPSEGNPPTVVNDEQSAIARQASQGVSSDEVDAFVNSWPGGTATPAAPKAETDFGFGDESF